MPRKGAVTKKPWTDPDDAPDLTEDFFRRAEIAEGGKVIRPAKGTLTRPRGRPKAERPTETLTLRLDAELVRALRETPDWRKRAAKALERIAKR